MVTGHDDKNERLPSGFVTFVFTDIVESTRLYRALGEDVAGDVFDKHNEILRTAWTNNRGQEVHTEGDSFFVAFEQPDDAVAACIELRVGLAHATWPPGGDIKVRIGIHTGLAAPRNGDYMALSVHQASRVMSAAHGDQILITDSTAQRLGKTQAASSTRIGAYRLRDFDEPPVLHRIDPFGLTSNDMPPRATPAQQHNLVVPLTSFVGRSSDRVSINGLLEPGKAITIVGLGGMGKTRLATEVGIEVAPTWPGGVWMVELAEVVEPALVADAIATALGVGSRSMNDRWSDVVEFIGDSQMLVVLDNVEHLIDACAKLVPDLLRSCPNVTLLCTSRESLNCAGEVVYRLMPLELGQELADPAEMPSVQLFVDRASTVYVNFEWTDQALADVREICAHLDGLPLAIEIAAAQVAVLSLPEIITGLDSRFRLLRSRDRALPARQRTMEGLLGWSYRRLSEVEQRAFRGLAVFSGSFSIEAAEAVLAATGIDGDDVPELVWALVDKSLLSADLSQAGTRYRLFESVQQYALRLLDDNNELVATATTHAHWLLERAAPWQRIDQRWLGEVATELTNIRAAVELISDIEPEPAQQLMCSIGRFHSSVQSYRTGIEEMTRAAERLTAVTPSRSALLTDLADLHLSMGNTAEAALLLDNAAVVQEGVGQPSWSDAAIDRLRGEIAMRNGDHQHAGATAEAVLKTEVSDRGAARMWSLLGVARASAGDLTRGHEALTQALNTYSKLDDVPATAIAFGNLAEVAWRQEDFRSAAEYQRACIDQAVTTGQPVTIANSLIMAAKLAGQRHDWHVALQLQASATTILGEAGHEPYADDRIAIDELIASAAADMTASAAAAAADQGRQLTIVEAVNLANVAFDKELSGSTSCV